MTKNLWTTTSSIEENIEDSRCQPSIEALGVGCTRGKKGNILRFFWGPSSFVKNAILITKVKFFLKSVKNSGRTLRFKIY